MDAWVFRLSGRCCFRDLNECICFFYLISVIHFHNAAHSEDVFILFEFVHHVSDVVD